MAETGVSGELSEVPKGTVEKEKCALDMSSYEDLPNVDGDRNADDKLDDEESSGAAGEVDSGNGNGNGKDDPDGSYVFVTRCDSAGGDPIDRDPNVECVHESHTVSEPKIGPLKVEVEAEAGELNVESGETLPLEDNVVVSAVEVSSDGEVINPSVDQDSVSVKGRNSLEFDAQKHGGEAKLEEQIDPDSTPQEQTAEPPTVVSDISNCGIRQPDDGKIESKKQANLESTPEEIQESDIMVSEVDLVHTGKEEVKEQDSIEPTQPFTDSEEVQDAVLGAADCKLSSIKDCEVCSQEHANTMETSGPERSQESIDKISEASGCRLPEFEVRETNAETPTVLNSPDRDEESSGTHIKMPDSVESESLGLDDREEAKVEEGDKIDLGEEIKENRKSLPVVTDNVHRGVHKGNESEKTDSDTDLRLEREHTVAHDVDENKGSRDETETSLDSPDREEESSENQIKMRDSAESESLGLDDTEAKVEEEQKTDLREDTMENQNFVPMVADNVHRVVDKGIEAAKVDNEINLALESEYAAAHDLDQNKSGNPSHTEDNISQTKVVNEFSNDSPNETELSGSSENADSQPCNADCVSMEIEIEPKQVENLLSSPAESVKLETGALNNIVGDGIVTGSLDVSSETDFGPSSIEPEGNVSIRSWADAIVDSDDPIEGTESNPIPVNSLDLQHSTNDSLENENDAGCECAPTCVPEAFDVQDGSDEVSNSGGNNENLISQETEDTGRVQKNETSTHSQDEPSADVLVEQSAGLEAVKRPFNFLIKIPRFEDEKLGEQIRHAQLQVDEKTQQRSAIRENIKIFKASYQHLQNNYEAAKSEERAARALVKLKRQEIDSVQSLINRVKNAMSIEDIDMRIHNMEHMMQHETLPLKEEKQFIREIKQLKQLRDQLSSNVGSQDEVQQALDQRDRIEEQLKTLKKELDCLKEKVSKAEAIVEASGRKCSDEGKKLKELNAQYKAADAIRQEAYAHFQNLRGQLSEKQSGFRAYRDELAAARKYASKGDKEAVHRQCVNQVERIVELWNMNDEFRNEYVRCNTRSTLRRFGTVDGRALGPDEEPAVLPSFVYERISGSLSTPGEAKAELQIQGQEKQMATVESEERVNKPLEKVAEQMEHTLKTNKPGKPSLRDGSATVSSRDETEEMPNVEHKQTKEEQELARKEEELRKQEAAAKLKEQQRLEEKVKAREALERKRRNAEKAQIRAELRAQKEAEQKEKEREKRAKKKERKKAAASDGPDGNNEGESLPALESPRGITKEVETKEGTSVTTRKPQKPYQFAKQSKTKSIPPPLRNKGKRKMQQWLWIIPAALVVLSLFLLGNIGFYTNLGRDFRNRPYGL